MQCGIQYRLKSNDRHKCALKCICMVQTNEAAVPMDTEAQMKEVRAENDIPEQSSAAEDAPLVSNYLQESSCTCRWFEACITACCLFPSKLI